MANKKIMKWIRTDVESVGIETYAAEDVVASGTCGDNLTWALTEDGTMTISGTGDMWGYYEVEDKTFFENPHRKEIKKVIIEEGVTGMGVDAFYNCTDLQEIKIPEGVTYIGSSAFSGCSSLIEIEIPDGVKRIEGATFEYCSNLKEVRLPDSITSIGPGAFNSCVSLQEIKMPDGVATIESMAFASTGLIKMEIPNGVNYIGYGVFDGCYYLEEVRLPDSVTSIGQAAFCYCRSLKEIRIPKGVTYIGSSAFFDCSGLTEIEIPSGVSQIMLETFLNCSGLKKVMIPDGVTTIDARAFYGCSQLEEIEIPSGVTYIGDYAFSGSRSLREVRFKGDAPEFGKKEGGELPDKNDEWGTFGEVTATVYYPKNNLTWTADKMQNYGGRLTWVAYGNSADELAIVLDVTDKTYLIGSGNDATIKCTGELKDFVNVAMDGQIVESSNYTVVEGSTVITFLSSYLDTLSAGDHVVTLNYTYGSVDTSLTVIENNTNLNTPANTNGTSISGNAGNVNGSSNSKQNGSMQGGAPKTGDSTMVMLWLFAVLAAGSGCFILFRRQRELHS